MTYRYKGVECDTVEEVVALVERWGAVNDGWITWDGGDKCPVADGTRTCVKFRNGREFEDKCPQYWTWVNRGQSGDIVAYKVIQS